MTSEHTVIVRPVSLYEVRVRRDRWISWADIVIDEHSGSLWINSDYGHWAYRWSHHGRKSLKHFLSEMVGGETDYLMRKLHGQPDEFHAKNTLSECRHDLAKKWLQGEITSVQRRYCWAFLKALRFTSFQELGTAIEDDDTLYGVFGDEWKYYPCVKDYPSGIRTFVKELWPVFVEQLKGEIQR